MAKSERPSPLFTLLVLISVYPVITLFSYLVEPLSTHWPVWQRTALLTPLMVFAMLYGLIPAIKRMVLFLSGHDQMKPSESLTK